MKFTFDFIEEEYIRLISAGYKFISCEEYVLLKQTKATFNFVEFTQIDTFWEEFQNHVLDSKPIYFKWANSKPETSYGLQPPKTLTKPTYVSSFHSTLAIEIRGYS